MRTPESESIGRRAAEAIAETAYRVEGISIAAEMENIGVCRQQFYGYEKGAAPDAVILARMAEAGYDVMYILTGRRST